MNTSRDNRKRKSWTQLSFKNKRTKAELVAQDQALSHRVYRTVLTVLFATGVCVLIGMDQGGLGKDLIPVIGLVFLIHAVLYLLIRRYHREVLSGVRRFGQMFMLVGVVLVLSWVGMYEDISPFWLPVPFLAMSLALIYSSMLSIHTSVAVACLLALMYHQEGAESKFDTLFAQVQIVVTLSIGSMVAILGVHRIRNRKRLFLVGATCGIAQFLVLEILSLWDGVPSFNELRDVSYLVEHLRVPAIGFANGLISGVVLTSLLPFLEDLFEVVTDMKLIELSDQNKPLLHQIALLAPGTWQHSLMVGQLAEEAAESIGANDLLARVGALYHDVGKMLKPNYFVENIQGEENPHDLLSPEMSRLIIVSHVKDGMAILKEERLPKPIIDMVPMHHGTTVVQYFYNKKRMQDDDGHEKADQQSFRYPGPRPTFPEAGILMLADTTEAIARTLKDPTVPRLRTVVRKVIHDKMQDGQLDDCDLTLSDLHRIEDAFVRVLASIHHQRIRYQKDVGDSEDEGSDGGGGNDRRSKGNGRPQNGGNGAQANKGADSRQASTSAGGTKSASTSSKSEGGERKSASKKRDIERTS